MARKQQLIKAARRQVAEAGNARGYEKALRKALETPFVSEQERRLIARAVRAARAQTTAEEARGLRRGLRRVSRTATMKAVMGRKGS